MKVMLNTQAQKDTANFALQMLVACALVAALFYSIWQVAMGGLKADSAVVGSIFTMFIVLVNFCFPNSIGSQKAQDTINTLATAASAPMTTTTTVETGKDAQHAQLTSPPETGNGQAVDLGGTSTPEPTPTISSATATGTPSSTDDDTDYAPSEARPAG